MDGIFNLTRPPKPRAEGSSPSAPAIKRGTAKAVSLFMLGKEPEARGTCRVRSRARPVDEKARVTKRRGRRVVRRLDAETKRRAPQEGKQVLLPLPEIRMLFLQCPYFFIKSEGLEH